MDDKNDIPLQPGFPEPESGSARPAEPAKPAEPASAAKPLSAWEAAAFEPQDPVQPAASQSTPSSGAPQQPASPYAAAQPEQPAPSREAPQQPESPYRSATQSDQPAPPSGAPQQPAPPAGAPQQPASPYGAAPAQPTPPYSPAQPGVQPGAAPSSGKAVASLVCGILAIVFAGVPFAGLVLGIVAVVLASKAIRESGKDGKATGGKVCGFIGIGLSVLVGVIMMASLLMFGSIALLGDSGSTTTSNTSTLLKDSPLAGGTAEKQSDAEAAAQAAVEAKLAELASGSDSVIRNIAQLADDGFYEQTDIYLSDIGVVSQDYARWITEGVTYDIDNVTVVESSGTGTVYVDIKARDVFAFLEDFGNRLDEYMDSEAYANASSESEVMSALGRLFQLSMDATANEYTTDYAIISVEKKGSSWQVDQDSWDFEMDYLFGLA